MDENTFILTAVNYKDKEEYPDKVFKTYDALEHWVYLNCVKWTSIVITVVREG
ncbi:MAG TPA: hypothetical protein VEP90_15230 [Methylomirabilota bacterium]|nr:hypothetical protein [Methylomirabilota bacterium]